MMPKNNESTRKKVARFFVSGAVSISMIFLAGTNSWGFEWFKKDSGEMMKKAVEKRTRCLEKVAKEARSDLGFRTLSSRCYIQFNKDKIEADKQLTKEIDESFEVERE